jgi:nicotinic acid mononucleotide adenylyltransferase
MDKQIKAIHESKLYGNFIEIGAGQPLATELFNVSGSSSTVNLTLSPYSVSSQVERYGVVGHRCVSREAVEYMLEIERMHNKDLDVNFIWVSSFQLDDCSHGWIVYMYKQKKVVLHVTLPKVSRRERIRVLGKLSVQIIEYAVNEKKMDMRYIDGIWSTNDISKINLIDYYHVMNPLNCWERLETNFRNKENPIIVYKGSFNPLHDGHLSIVTHCQKKYPESPVGLMISMSTFKKGEIKNIEKRIEEINKKGLYTIITENGMFKKNIKELNTRLPGQEWVFPIGYDTYERMEKELFVISNVRYIVFDRDNKIDFDKPGYKSCEYVKFDSSLKSSDIRKK